jgi:hypothetical protein
MINITRPDDDAETVFRRAALRTRDVGHRSELLGMSVRVGERTAEYLELANSNRLFQMKAEEPVGISSERLSNLYDRVLVKGKERPLYDRIKASAKFNLCPLCGQRDVKTLDHYLPRCDYPELAVFPVNLVPCCPVCNKSKLAHVATAHDEQTFHPYFDDWNTHRILHATIEVDQSVSVIFSIVAAPGFPAENVQRARHHFDLLELGQLYGVHAAVELVESKDIFRRHFADGAAILRNELRHTALSCQRSNLNSWRAALYWGLAQSDDFCNGGFHLIEE